MPWNRIIGGGGLAVAGLLYLTSLTAYLTDLAVHPGALLDWYDLNVYNDAGLITRQLPSILYTWQLTQGVKFTYTPFAALVFALGSLLSWATLRWLMTVSSLAAVPVAAWLTRGARGGRARAVDRAGGEGPVSRPDRTGAAAAGGLGPDPRRPAGMERDRGRDRGRHQAGPAAVHPLPAGRREDPAGADRRGSVRRHDRGRLRRPARAVGLVLADRLLHPPRPHRRRGLAGQPVAARSDRAGRRRRPPGTTDLAARGDRRGARRLGRRRGLRPVGPASPRLGAGRHHQRARLADQLGPSLGLDRATAGAARRAGDGGRRPGPGRLGDRAGGHRRRLRGVAVAVQRAARVRPGPGPARLGGQAAPDLSGDVAARVAATDLEPVRRCGRSRLAGAAGRRGRPAVLGRVLQISVSVSA